MTKTYAQLTREIQALQASAEKLRAAEVKAAIARLNESIAEYGLTASDLHFPASASTSTRRQASSSNSSRVGASGAKYSDGQGNTWGGRGPRPAWLRSAIAGGRSLESFETAEGATSTGAGGRASKDTGSGSRIKLPALYGHPKTGQTWSGRGPKPAWLKQGLKKRGASIDDFLISSQAPAAATQTDTMEASAKPGATAVSAPGAKARATATTGKSADASRKSPPQKTGAQPKSASSPAADGPGRTAPVAAARKNKDVRAAANPAASAPAKKAAAKAPAKPAVKAPAKAATKPATKTASAPRKNLPASMAPPADAAPAPSTVPTAAPMPVPQSDSVEGRGEPTGR